MAASTSERLDKHDREIAAIRLLAREGVHLMTETRKDLRSLAAVLRKSKAAQECMDTMLREFISSTIQGSNGHAKGSVS